MNNTESTSTPEEIIDPTANPVTDTASTATISKADYEELYGKYIRLYSDFENYKKRAVKERSEIIQMGGSEVMKTILPVLDDLERATKAMDDTNDIVAAKEGVLLIASKLKTSLQQRGLEEMNSIGEVFNSDFQEAIANIPTEDESKKGTIIAEVEKGYLLHGKVIRYAKVVVAN